MIVLDCCAAVEIARGTPQGRALQMLFENGERVISSSLFLIELSSVFAKFVRTGAVTQKQAIDYVETTVRLVNEFVPIEENYLEAFNESLKLQHSAYDLLYFTLARRKAATLVTLDAKLMALCEQQKVDCIHSVKLEP